jgi:protein involved in polysaccharide export with SLBB domain
MRCLIPALMALVVVLAVDPGLPAQSSSAGGTAPEAEAFRVRLGDVLQIQIRGQPDLDLTLTVFHPLEISYPGVGKLVFAGKTPGQLEAEIAQLLAGRNILGAEVAVLVEEATPDRVYIQGAVMQQQQVEVPRHQQLRLSQLIALAGGLDRDADPAKVVIRRRDPAATGGSRVIPVDLNRLSAGSPEVDPVLEDGDSVIVPSSPRRGYWVHGEVKRPGEYLIEPGVRLTVGLALIRAGGLTDMGSSRRVKLVRSAAGGSQQVLDLDMGDVLKDGDMERDVPLQAGDIIIVNRRLF